MPNAELEQERALLRERELTKQFAGEVSKSISSIAGAYTDLPTAGPVSNLASVLIAWEHERIKQIDQQLIELSHATAE